MFRNSFPRLEPVSPDGLATIERGWMRLVSEIGVRFDHPEAVRILVEAGQRAEGDIVFFDPRMGARAGCKGSVGIYAPCPQRC